MTSPSDRRVQIQGRRFGRLVALRPATPKEKGSRSRWVCACDCGVVREFLTNNLTRGGSQSCGCVTKEKASARWRKHGLTDTVEHIAWRAMIGRCENPRRNCFAHYGGRGIRVCERWRESFENFLADMGPRPGKGYSVDRIDNDGNYEPSNCRWATFKEQARNKSRNRFLTHNGETLCLKEWAERCGINWATLHMRLSLGWSVADALTRPVARTARWCKTGNHAA